MRDYQAERFAAVYGAMVVAQVQERHRLTGEWPDDEMMERFVEEAHSVATQAEEAWDRWVASNLASVCPGCHAVAPERCAPGCIDAEIARREEDSDATEADRG